MVFRGKGVGTRLSSLGFSGQGSSAKETTLVRLTLSLGLSGGVSIPGRGNRMSQLDLGEDCNSTREMYGSGL